MYYLTFGYDERNKYEIGTVDDDKIMDLLRNLYEHIKYKKPIAIGSLFQTDTERFTTEFTSRCNALATDESVFLRYTPPELEADDMTDDELDFYTREIQVYKPFQYTTSFIRIWKVPI